MAAPVCTIASLNLACFRGQVLNQKQQLALMVYFMAAELNGIGGTNYLGNLTGPGAGTLLDNTTQLLDKVTMDELKTFDLAIARNTAVATGGTVDTDIQTRMQQIKCLVNVQSDVLYRMYIYLKCQLGVHKTFPQ